MAEFRPSNSSMERITVLKDALSSARSSSSFVAMILSMREFKMLGKRRVKAEPATDEREARAFALKVEIGEAVRVGIRFGRMIFDRVVSVSKVKSAASALSASSSVRRRFNR